MKISCEDMGRYGFRHALLLASALLVAACGGSEEVETEPRPVAWIEVGRGTAQDETANVFPGTIRARQQTRVGFEVPGRISSIQYDIGEAFPRGAPLATIERNDYRLRVAEANAALAESEARVSQAAQDLERQEALFAREATSEANLERSRAQAASLRQISQANSARLGIARESLSDTTLRAPFAGRVARRLLEQGAQVQPGEPVFEIDGIGLEVSFTVARSQRQRLEISDQITVLMDRNGETIEIPGSITEISSRAVGIGAFEVVANVPGEVGQLQAGMAVDVRVENAPDDSADSAITIPLTAFKPTARGRGEVYLIDPESGKIEARPVRLGPASKNSVVVAGGLREGDQIVSRGIAFVEPGETVSRIGKGAERYAK